MVFDLHARQVRYTEIITASTEVKSYGEYTMCFHNLTLSWKSLSHWKREYTLFSHHTACENSRKMPDMSGNISERAFLMLVLLKKKKGLSESEEIFLFSFVIWRIAPYLPRCLKPLEHLCNLTFCSAAKHELPIAVLG